MTGEEHDLWIVASRVRREERRILDEFAVRGIDVGRIDPRVDLLGTAEPPWRGGIVLNREISASRAVLMAEALEADGACVLNSSASARVTTNKWATYLALREAGIATPQTRLAATPAAAKRVIDRIRFPIVIKPLNASHGNRVSLATDAYAFEAILEHCGELPVVQQQMMLLQEFVGAADSDLRIVVVGDRCVGAIARSGDDWRNNVARGARVTTVQVTEELRQLALGAARAVGATFAGVDVVVRESGELLVLDINGGVEFSGFESAGNSVADSIVDTCLTLLSKAVPA